MILSWSPIASQLSPLMFICKCRFCYTKLKQLSCSYSIDFDWRLRFVLTERGPQFTRTDIREIPTLFAISGRFVSCSIALFNDYYIALFMSNLWIIVSFASQVVHSLEDENKKKLLFFVTGCDRAPIKGLANLHFVISRNGKRFLGPANI